jgi:membrane protease YdiL (CAAX protease family)
MTERSVISAKNLSLVIIPALILFIPLFILRGIGLFDFWWWMSSNIIVMTAIALVIEPGYLKILKEDFSSKVFPKIFYGIFSAILLYGVFWVGNYLSRKWFGFAGEGIENVYSFKGDATFYRILILMGLIIGPGEEIFWRGVLQRWFGYRSGSLKGFIFATLIYTGVHVFSFNPMLILAAFIAGLFWGYMYYRYRSLLANVVSHTVWDVAVFLVFPFS